MSHYFYTEGSYLKSCETFFDSVYQSPSWGNNWYLHTVESESERYYVSNWFQENKEIILDKSVFTVP